MKKLKDANGLTPRDLFAMHIVTGLVTSTSAEDVAKWRSLHWDNNRIAQMFAFDAYTIADAMVTERGKKRLTASDLEKINQHNRYLDKRGK